MSKPNVANLIEDPNDPDFKHEIVDDDGVEWSALLEDVALPTEIDPAKLRMISHDPAKRETTYHMLDGAKHIYADTPGLPAAVGGVEWVKHAA